MPAIFRCFVLFALLMTMQSANAQPPEASPEHTPEASPQQRQAHRPIVLAYIPSYKPAPVDQLAFDKLTHICHAFATVTPKGQFTTWEYMPDSKLVSQAHEHGVKVLLSLGGADSDHLLAPVAADDVKRNAFVDDVIDFMLKHHYDGVDVDWEFPDSKASAQGFIKLVKALSSKLNTLKQQTGRHYIMSRAVGGGWAYRNIPTEVFTNNFDFINVMGPSLADQASVRSSRQGHWYGQHAAGSLACRTRHSRKQIGVGIACLRTRFQRCQALRPC
jgi:GH18 family chitinase